MSSSALSTWARVGVVGAVVLGTFGVIGVLGAPTGAQSSSNDAEAASVIDVATPLAGNSTSPSVSSNGNVVVFSNSGGTEFAHAVVVRQRDVPSTAVFDAGQLSTAAAVSANGCIVAYSAVVDAPPPVTTTTTTTTTTTLTTEPPVDPPETGPQQLQAATVVELRVLDTCVSEAIVVEPKVLTTIVGAATLPQPALSSDGDVVAVSTGTGVLHVGGVLGTSPVITEIDGVNDGDPTGSHVDVSADGLTVVFDATLAEVANVYTWTAAEGTVLLTSATDAPATPGEGSSSWPTLSSDGSLVAFQSQVGTDAPSIDLIERSDGSRRTITTNASRPTLAADGKSIIYDAADAVRVARSDSTVPFEASTEKIVSRAVTGLFESVGSSVTGATLSADGSVAIFDSPAGAELTSAPGFAAAGHVWVRLTEPIFTPPTTTTLAPSTVVTTTIAATTTTRATAPSTTRVVGTIPPRTTTRPTAPVTTRATTTTTAVPRPATFDPAAFEFAPTIIDAGRRTADVELVNPSSIALTVTDVDIDPVTGSDFAIDASTCGGVLPAGSRCVITISFAPTATGEATANIVARFGNGTTATSALRGLGADAPVIEVRPGVASNGQVVSIFGFGFPAGADVELSWRNGLVERTLVIDDRGEFVATMVVLPNTGRGPTELTVAGQTDLFRDVTTSLLVSDSPDRTPSVVFRSPIGG